MILQFGSILSALSIEESLILGKTEIYNDQLNLRAISFYIEPAYQISYNLKNNLSLNFRSGWENRYSREIKIL